MRPFDGKKSKILLVGIKYSINCDIKYCVWSCDNINNNNNKNTQDDIYTW